MRFRDKVALRAIETVSGTLETIADSDAVLTRALAATSYAGNRVSEDLDRAGLGNDRQINTNPHASFSYEIPLIGSGVTATAPPWAADLRACGMAITDDVATNDEWYFTPVDDNFESMSFRFRRGATLMQESAGCRGNWAINLAAGELPSLTISNLMGDYRRPVAPTGGAPDSSAFNNSIPITKTNTPLLTLGGTVYAVSAFSVDGGNDVQRINEINREESVIVDRKPTGSITVRPSELSEVTALMTALENHAAATDVAIICEHNTVAGQIVRIELDGVSFNDIQEQDQNGEVYYQIPFNVLNIGNEIKIIQK